MQSIYTSGDYLQTTQTWHAEDSPWKAEQIMRMLQKHALQPKSLTEIGCGAGNILRELSQYDYLQGTHFSGYDISPQAIRLCQEHASSNLKFYQQDLLATDSSESLDMLLAMDVFEHVPDYMGFIKGCKRKATYKLYHIPLEIHVSSVLRNSFIQSRYTIGHIHYFSADSALATLRDTGHEVVDFAYTNGALDLFRQHPSVKRAIANGPRWLLSKLSTPLAARLLGGYSLLVLTK
jgi:cyclopropane fatty-acyl-phospholipid synthase-like methyltransferase